MLDGAVGVTMMKMGMMDEIMVERVVEKKKKEEEKKGNGKVISQKRAWAPEDAHTFSCHTPTEDTCT